MPITNLNLNNANGFNKPQAQSNSIANLTSELNGQKKLTAEQKDEIVKQAKATEIANKKSLLQTMFAKGKEGDSKALRIFYQEAAVSIEDILKKDFGEGFSLQGLVDKTSGVEGQEDYWSSENTADRIVTGATAYFEQFRTQNPRLSQEELVERYMNLVGPALEKGMGEAKNILEGIGAFEGHIKDTVSKTEELVWEKMEAFRQKMLPAKQED